VPLCLVLVRGFVSEVVVEEGVKVVKEFNGRGKARLRLIVRVCEIFAKKLYSEESFQGI
jgi:hypothetical protein